MLRLIFIVFPLALFSQEYTYEMALEHDQAYKCPDTSLYESGPTILDLTFVSDKASYYHDTIITLDTSLYKIEDFTPLFKTIAKSENLIAMNEVHHNPDHRNTAIKLLDILWENGFKHIGIEAIGSYDTLLNTRKYPQYMMSGGYLRDPRFGEFARMALQKGFQIYGYDAVGAKDREFQAAFNLYNYMSENEVKKLFIYNGLDHIVEGDGPAFDSYSVTTYLKMFLKQDVYTISQTDIGIKNRNILAGQKDTHVVLKDKSNGKHLGSIIEGRGIDLAIIRTDAKHPFITNLKKIEPPISISKDSELEPLIGLAYYKEETLNPVPASISYIKLEDGLYKYDRPFLLKENREYLIKYYGCKTRTMQYEVVIEAP